MSRARKLLLLLSVGSAGLLALHTLFAESGWQRRVRAQEDLAALDTEIAGATARIERLRADIDAMRTRPEVQEHAVRDELGYARAGERVIELGGN